MQRSIAARPVIECNGADLYFEDHGAGQPIVFLHGATAGFRYFEPQLTAMSGEYRTIAVDFRGHGRFEKSDLGHTLQHCADDVRWFIEKLDLDDVVLVGWSMGVIVSWEYIHQFGTDRILALVDIDMEPSPLKREDYDYGSYEIDVPRLVCAGADEKWRSVASVQYVAELVSNARFERFENSGHCLTVAEPERFNRVLGDFIDTL